MEEQTQPGYLPLRHYVLWLVLRAGIMIWGVYGLFHGSTVEFLEAIFAILFTHMWRGGRHYLKQPHKLSQL